MREREMRLNRIERGVYISDDPLEAKQEITIENLRLLIKEDVFKVIKFAIIATLPQITKALTKVMEQPAVNYELVTTREVMKRWGKSRTTIIKHCKEGRLNPAGKRGREFMFSSIDLVRVFGYPNE